ncbi:xylulokinase [Lentibacillus persicus]|uniref:Xylulose kinase n=1 Tax=Lentibacillus persicus TaxID=640948 RepID=A0A1I1W625_9BACI|nr:xylulokinase [Lentibacillus persicus]SFD88440.1 xylulokinase [Lentibacillus persicus]
MGYVLGIDLGTSSVKGVLVDRGGVTYQSISKTYPLINEKPGYSEQDPHLWYKKTVELVSELVSKLNGKAEKIEGISFSGQMHGLVLIDDDLNVLRNAILWNDTRTAPQCREIHNTLGKEKLLDITKNRALEGFTLPKLLWVKKNEKGIFDRIKYFLLPKDYLRFRLTGNIQTDYSDAAGTLLLDVANKKWSEEICETFGVNKDICPPLVESHEFCGTITSHFADETGLSSTTKVFAGGADNACGAIGSGVLTNGKALCSIGTSGVMLSYDESGNKDYKGKLHYFNHGKQNAFYSMGVTLSAGYSLQWFQQAFRIDDPLESLFKELDSTLIGAQGLIFTPYLVGERTPYADASIRASFIGMDTFHEKKHFVRAIMEGVTFSLKESLDLLRENNIEVNSIISIGGGSKNNLWLQMQADIFNTRVIKLSNDQGPSLGAAILAAYGCGWYNSLEECAKVFITYEKYYDPIEENVEKYNALYDVYKKVYSRTRDLNRELEIYR